MDPRIKIPTPKILFTVWIEANVHSPTKNTLNLLLFYVPMYPSLNVTFIEIILVYTVKSTKTTKRNNWCYISGLVFFWTLVRDIPVMTEPLFTGGTMWLETWSNLGLIKYWDTSDCLLLNHRNKSIHSLISILPIPVTLQWFLTIASSFSLRAPIPSLKQFLISTHCYSWVNLIFFYMKQWTEN